MRIGENVVLREKLFQVQRSLEDSEVLELKRLNPHTPDHVLLNVVRAKRKFSK